MRISTASYDVYFGTDYNDVNDNAVWLADLDRSGTVGLSDLEILTAQWLTDPCSASPSADFDGDGIVDMADFAVIAGQWQQSSGLTYKGNQAVTTYDPTGTLDYGVYYWRIDEVDGDFVKKGQFGADNHRPWRRRCTSQRYLLRCPAYCFVRYGTQRYPFRSGQL
ncbi:MAG: hypothetical protein B6I25_08300 [Planctomycetales bacterium 4572_13]|nr:MAG: hypothetical protein B6I25_08300 [Planctomycetales bacterium 4572_13]